MSKLVSQLADFLNGKGDATNLEILKSKDQLPHLENKIKNGACKENYY